MAPAIEMEHRAPAGPLAPLVRRYVGYRFSGLAPGVHLGLPSPDLVVVLSLGPRTTIEGVPRGFDTLVGGLHTRPVVLTHEGEGFGVQVDLTPAGSRALLGARAADLGATVLPLGDVAGPAAARLRDAVGEAATWPERFALLDRLLAAHLGAARPVRPELDHAWRLLVGGGGTRRVADVAGALGWSRRHLHESFLGEYGLGPKELARVARFNRSKVLLQHAPAANLAGVAARCGYSDQSHLAREWNRLAGCPPSRWLGTEELSFVQDGAGDDGAGWSA